jgi:uncharacterized protein YycO/glucan-binding YG repeat protein
MKKYSKSRWAIVIAIALVGILALAGSAFAASTAATQSNQPQSGTTILEMSDLEVINNVETLIGNEEVKSWVVGKRSELNGEEVKAVADMIRNGYALENALPLSSELYMKPSDSGESALTLYGAPSGSTDSSWHPGGAYSAGVGTYPTQKGKILVTGDWLAGSLPTGHSAIVLNSQYAWSSYPKIFSPAVGGTAIEGVQRETNDWNDPTRRTTCFAVDVVRASDSQESAAVDWCAQQAGKPYNFNFLNTTTRSSFYCSQLTWAAFKDLYGIDLNTSEWTIGGINTVHPLEFVHSKETVLLYRQGTAEIGWQIVDGCLYYIDRSGNPVKGWQTIEGVRYYFDASGVAANGRILLDGVWYEFVDGRDVSTTVEEPSYPNGVYTISTTLSPAKSLMIAGSSTLSGVRLQTGTDKKMPSQRFRFSYDPADGYYVITNVKSDKVLEIPKSSVKSGQIVSQNTSKGTDVQKWRIISRGTNPDGSFSVSLAPKLNPSLRLNVQHASAADSVALELQAANEASQSQVFRINQQTQVVANGTYTIEASYVNKVLYTAGGRTAIGTRFQLWTPNSTGAQKFQLTYDTKTGYYLIDNPQSKMVLDVMWGIQTSGTAVHLWPNNSTYAQRWVIEKDGSGYRIYAAHSGLALDAASAGTANGTAIRTWTPNGTEAQLWKLTVTG